MHQASRTSRFGSQLYDDVDVYNYDLITYIYIYTYYDPYWHKETITLFGSCSPAWGSLRITTKSFDGWPCFNRFQVFFSGMAKKNTATYTGHMILPCKQRSYFFQGPETIHLRRAERLCEIMFGITFHIFGPVIWQKEWLQCTKSGRFFIVFGVSPVYLQHLFLGNQQSTWISDYMLYRPVKS